MMMMMMMFLNFLWTLICCGDIYVSFFVNKFFHSNFDLGSRKKVLVITLRHLYLEMKTIHLEILLDTLPCNNQKPHFVATAFPTPMNPR